MRTFDIVDKETRVVVRKGNIEEEATDIILNWVGSDLRSGPRSFFDIHLKAGPQLFNSFLSYEANMNSIRETDAFTTLPGLLACNLVVHAIMPTYEGNYMKTFMNIALTIGTFKKDNLARALSMYIPECPDIIMIGIKEFLLDVGLDEVVVLYKTESERKKICDFFGGFEVKHTLWDKIDVKIIAFLLNLGGLPTLDCVEKLELFFKNAGKARSLVKLADDKQMNDKVTTTD